MKEKKNQYWWKKLVVKAGKSKSQPQKESEAQEIDDMVGDYDKIYVGSKYNRFLWKNNQRNSFLSQKFLMVEVNRQVAAFEYPSVSITRHSIHSTIVIYMHLWWYEKESVHTSSPTF